MGDVYNINVGVLGHVDSGKTALVAALSDVLSVAALDKHPQSQERGITLDVGFSAFKMPCPDHLQARFSAKTLQFTLVDCPGHASLLKTVLVGAQIIDMMLLVIDSTKGIQAQTAECIIVGELLSQCAVVALNKVDLFQPETRQKSTRRAGRNVVDALKLTRFASAEIVPVAARVAMRTSGASSACHCSGASGVATGDVPIDAMHGSGGEGATTAAPVSDEPALEGGRDVATGAAKAETLGIDELKATLLRAVPKLSRDTTKPLLFMADHCFTVKGHGTVLSGTVLQGSVARGDTVELPESRLERKVKSLQCFKEPCSRVSAGDRAGMCLTNVSPAKLERVFVSAPGLLRSFSACVCVVQRCRFYTGPIWSRQKVFITVGHQTCMASVLFFGLPDGQGCSQVRLAKTMFSHIGKNATNTASFDVEKEYLFQEELYGVAGRPLNLDDPLNTVQASSAGAASQEEAHAQHGRRMHYGMEWALLVFDRPLLCLPGSVMISTKFDLDIEQAGPCCRIAFYGNVARILPEVAEQNKIKLFRLKFRQGIVDRVTNDGDAIVKDMFKKDSDLQLFKGNEVVSLGGAVGKIIGSFGSSGKVRVTLQGEIGPGQKVTMRMKKHVPCNLQVIRS